ncbi:MAG: NAD(P)-dependent oxidoreductase [Caldilineaceae bacterium]|nr:NAD(P)-dependent oxidoreductase [Caldilineaceae bacterium]
MNLLITSAASPLAQRIADGLRPNHTVRLTERMTVTGLADLAISPLGSDFSTNLLVRGVEAIVHVAEPLSTDSDHQRIDYLTRCTYNLCMAAAAEGVKRLVYLNTLDVMAAYEPDYLVGESWRPRPTPAAPLLAKHLGEATCREFAREFKLEVVSLRLGTVIPLEDDNDDMYPMWLDARDAVQVVDLALTKPLIRRWSVFHIQHKADNARFPISHAEQELGFAPQYNRVESSAKSRVGGGV